MTTILIVEDNDMNMKLARDVLSANSFDVLEAKNGEDGVASALAHKPDLVLMDIVMPGLNGFQATRQLNKDRSTTDIPVVIVTTKDQETDRVWGKRQGARAFLTKPVDQKILLRTINSLI